MVTCAFRWFKVPYAFSHPFHPHLYILSISSYRLLGRLCCCAPGIGTKEYTVDSGWPPWRSCQYIRSSTIKQLHHLPEVVSASYARPCLVLHRQTWLVNGRTLAAGSAQPNLGDRNASAGLHTAESLAAAGKASSYEEGDRSGSTELSKDLLVHLRQISRYLACCRLALGHWAWIKTDLMFAPYPRAHLSHLLGSDSAAGRCTTAAECTPGTSRSAQTAADRSLSSASQRRRSWRTCSLERAGTAQQTLDLQMTLQTGARYTSRTESSNLTAGIPAAYHPWTGDGLVGGATQGSHLVTLLDSGLAACCRLWT